MKNKKASMFLPTKTLDLVIGVIVISLLFFIAFKIGSTFLEGQQERQAKALFEEIETTIKYIEDNPDINNDSVLLLNPHEWYLVINDTDNLICICKEKEYSSCNEREFCYLSGYKIKEPEKNSIEIVKKEEGGKEFFKELVISIDEDKKEIDFFVNETKKDYPNPSTSK